MKKYDVILDTDTYNECDDQFALSYMLRSPDVFNIEAITVAPFSNKVESVVSGREKSYDEICKICGWLGFDAEGKVYRGAADYICNGCCEPNEATEKITEVLEKNEKTYILAIGAITNVALVLKLRPDLVNKAEVVWLGGHSMLQSDNREFNFMQDVDAVRIVYESGVKLTVIPCKNVASNLRTTIYEISHYLKGKSELCDYLVKRFYDDGYHENLHERRVIWDISVIAYMINKDWFTSSDISCPMINDDTSYTPTEGRHTITMVNNINVDRVYADLFSKLA